MANSYWLTQEKKFLNANLDNVDFKIMELQKMM